MSPEVFVEILREAMFMVIVLVSAVIVPSLIVGLVVAVFQAATSINEQTMSFLPRLLVTLLALSWGGNWGLVELRNHKSFMHSQIYRERFISYWIKIKNLVNGIAIPPSAGECFLIMIFIENVVNFSYKMHRTIKIVPQASSERWPTTACDDCTPLELN